MGNILEYLGTEEHNLLVTLIKLSDELGLLEALDQIYQKPQERLKAATKEEATLSQLYMFVHFHMYFSISCLLRGHLSESFASNRKAVDACLSAYRIIDKPELAERYRNRDKEFQFIKAIIDRERKNDPSKYPLAISLLNAHDIFSQYGSHADISTFARRLGLRHPDDKSDPEMFLNYFQYPADDRTMKFDFVFTLTIFLRMFRVFKLWFDEKFRIIDTTWEYNIETLGHNLERLGRSLRPPPGDSLRKDIIL